MLTERDIAALRVIAHHFVLSRAQVQRLVFADDPTGRITRRRLQALIDEKLIQRHPVTLVVPNSNTVCPVYFPTAKGTEFLATHLRDDRWLGVATQQPQSHHLLHWMAVSETHIVIDEAIQNDAETEILGWFNEWDVLRPQETAPDLRFRLFTKIHENPRLVCVPDAAFLLELRGHRKVFYLEVDRNTTGARHLAASKTKGYAAMAERQLHRRHFPEATVDSFTVLFVAPSANRRDAVRRAFHDAPRADLWKFCACDELTPQSFLHDRIWYPKDGEPVALIKPNPPATGESS